MGNGNGPPASICFLKSGITEPLLPKTFPNLVVINLVLFSGKNCKDCTNNSADLLDAPITLVGFTALSVETITNVFTLFCTESLARFFLFPIYLPKLLREGYFRSWEHVYKPLHDIPNQN